MPKRYAIACRNRWMIEQADCVVTCVVHPAGSGAAVFKGFAERRGKTAIELGEKQP